MLCKEICKLFKLRICFPLHYTFPSVLFIDWNNSVVFQDNWMVSCIQLLLLKLKSKNFCLLSSFSFDDCVSIKFGGSTSSSFGDQWGYLCSITELFDFSWVVFWINHIIFLYVMWIQNMYIYYSDSCSQKSEMLMNSFTFSFQFQTRKDFIPHEFLGE